MPEAFKHAFDWLGFGAKTAVGYGQMRRDEQAEKDAEAARQKAEQEAAMAGLPPEEQARQQALRGLKAMLEEEQRVGRPNPSGLLAHMLSQLMQEASRWPPEDRQ